MSTTTTSFTPRHARTNSWCGRCTIANLCQECNQARFAEKKRVENNFDTWSSRNEEIDNYLKKRQLEHIEDPFTSDIQWIPYKDLKEVKFLRKGGESTIYTGVWVNDLWSKERKVVLKCLNSSEGYIEKLLRELDLHVTLWWTKIPLCYGVTIRPGTNYMLVIEYADLGDLRRYLELNFKSMTWLDRLQIVLDISCALRDIHAAGFNHGDLHSGNVLRSERGGFYVSDLGLSSESILASNNKRINGLLPYVAPEVLRTQQYTEQADIFSFGMIMWEVTTGRPPFGERNHDLDLVLDIIAGDRPKKLTKAPNVWCETIERCWSGETGFRPSASELHKTFMAWKTQKIYEQWDAESENEVFSLTFSFGSPPYASTDTESVYITKQYDFVIPDEDQDDDDESFEKETQA